MTIEEWAIANGEEEIDIDVCDTDVDMCVAFCYTLGDEDDDYEKFLKLLAENVEVDEEQTEEAGGDVLVCRFSDFYAKHRESLESLFYAMGWECSEFDIDEIEYEMTMWTERLVAGYESEITYALVLSGFL